MKRVLTFIWIFTIVGATWVYFLMVITHAYDDHILLHQLREHHGTPTGIVEP